MSGARPTVLASVRLPDEVVAPLHEGYDVVRLRHGTSEVPAEHRDAVGWLTGPGSPVTAEAVASLPSLRGVSQFGVGYDNVDVDALTARGLPLGHTPGVLDDAVAELALAMVLAQVRGVARLDRWVRAGGWQQGGPPLTHDVHGSTVGILGLGRIGRRLAELLAPLRVEVLYHNRRPVPDVDEAGLATYVGDEELYRRSDVVVVLTPLTPATTGLVGERELALMKPTASLVNLARGPVVDEPALVRALQSGTIAGAALDVYVEEPLPADSPLRDLPDVLLLPHVGSATEETRRAMAELAVANLLDLLEGRLPRACANRDALT